MLAMRKRKMKRDYSSKIPGRSVPEVTGPFERELSRQASDRRVKFFGAQLPAEVLTNAIVLHFFSLTESERDAIVDRFGKEFEEMVRLAADQAGSGEGPEPTDESMPGGAKLTRRGNGRSDVG